MKRIRAKVVGSKAEPFTIDVNEAVFDALPAGDLLLAVTKPFPSISPEEEDSPATLSDVVDPDDDAPDWVYQCLNPT